MEAQSGSSSSAHPPSVYRNWMVLLGLFVAVGSVLTFILLFLLDVFGAGKSPYVGVVAYLLVPAVFFLGLMAIAAGLVLARFKIHRVGGAQPPLVIDLSKPATIRRLFALALVGTVLFLFAAVVSYLGYHFSESSTFCGEVCHTPMKPEYTTYLNSPHARIACSECHIGSGAEWFVKAKISGLYQVYSVFFNKFHRPIETPVKNLRPAQQTCEQCHWPRKFSGNRDRVYSHFLTDETNTPFAVRLSLKVGGSDPTHGPVGGIHWHMNVANKIEYIASDEQRQVIPWVRVTDQQGVVTIYQATGFKPAPEKDIVRRMDCMDCHNRPAHIFQTPNQAVDVALSLGRIDPTIPYVKKSAIEALTQKYENEEDALQKIATRLHEKYASDPRYKTVVDVVQEIYKGNFFPEMNTSWETHPNNLGHKEWPGCFRCHDGEHKTADGKRSIKADDCNACHVILAQGSGEQLLKLNPAGHAFEHPGGDVGDMKCSDCHKGAQ